jgi:hypothetical protein
VRERAHNLDLLCWEARCVTMRFQNQLRLDLNRDIASVPNGNCPG